MTTFYPLLFLIAFSLTIQNAEIDSQDILRQLMEQQKIVRTLQLKVAWEDFEKGKINAWDINTIYRDEFGRMRLIGQSGSYDINGARFTHADHPQEVDTLYDGENTVETSIYPQWDRLGKPLNENNEKGGYRSAIIQDGKSTDLKSRRNPMTIMTDSLVSYMVKWHKENKEVRVEKIEDTSQYRVIFEGMPAHAKSAQMRTIAILDSAKGWQPLKLETFELDGRLLMQDTCEYSQDQQRNWVPIKGSIKRFPGEKSGEMPTLDWRFQIIEVQINATDFDHGVFKLVLEPDTAVWDGRYKVNYRVGDEKVFADQLAALAEHAKTLPLGTGRGDLSLRKRSWLYLVIPAIIFFTLGGYWIYRRSRTKKTA